MSLRDGFPALDTSDRQCSIAGYEEAVRVSVFRTELTTVLTTMTTVELPHDFTYTTTEIVPCLVAPLACAYGSEGWGFESLRARTTQRRFPSLWEVVLLHIDDSSVLLTLCT